MTAPDISQFEPADPAPSCWCTEGGPTAAAGTASPSGCRLTVTPFALPSLNTANPDLYCPVCGKQRRPIRPRGFSCRDPTFVTRRDRKPRLGRARSAQSVPCGVFTVGHLAAPDLG